MIDQKVMYDMMFHFQKMMFEFDVDVWFLEKVMYDVSFSA